MNALNRQRFSKARRRVSMRSALFLLLIAFAIVTLQGGIAALLPGTPQGVLLALRAFAVLAAFGMTAYMGLYVLDGDHHSAVPMRVLGSAQILYLTLTGVLYVCPASLAADMIAALLSRMGLIAPAQPSAALGLGLFLPSALVSGLLAPVCEELFFRGYLLPALLPRGRRRAVLASALAFALMHGVDAALPMRTVLGCMLGLMLLRAGSILAPMLAHAAYNLTILLLSFSGLERIVCGTGLFACLVRLLGCAALVFVFKRAYACRACRQEAKLTGGGKFTRREIALLAGAGAALLISMIVSGVSA